MTRRRWIVAVRRRTATRHVWRGRIGRIDTRRRRRVRAWIRGTVGTVHVMSVS
jgi:hypothetical protein